MFCAAKLTSGPFRNRRAIGARSFDSHEPPEGDSDARRVRIARDRRDSLRQEQVSVGRVQPLGGLRGGEDDDRSPRQSRALWPGAHPRAFREAVQRRRRALQLPTRSARARRAAPRQEGRRRRLPGGRAGLRQRHRVGDHRAPRGRQRLLLHQEARAGRLWPFQRPHEACLLCTHGRVHQEEAGGRRAEGHHHRPQNRRAREVLPRRRGQVVRSLLHRHQSRRCHP
mmetsp:Transcript_2491/g.5234  ORF Transcript_2491/g.5234 Transcript_2491/m.5234 type:complete len:226 (-) Transcript_2491:368-1045(-)